MSAYLSSEVRESSGEHEELHYRHIDPAEWRAFFDIFSRQHLGTPVTIEVETPEIGSHNLVQHAPLMGITASGGAARETTIELVTSESPEGLMSHTIDHPQRVTFGDRLNDDRSWIEIEAETGEVVTIRWKT